MFDIFHDHSKFKLTDSFYIDDGELEGITPQEIFVLGVEWEMLRATIDFGRTLENYPFHPNNKMRVEKMLQKRKAIYEISEDGGWLFLTLKRSLFPYVVAE
jgi:hypothetical protein